MLDGAVYDLYAAEDITHPDGVTGVVDYSRIVDANGNPIWHTTIRDNSGQWISDYLPVLKKDNLVASAKIENGWLTFSNLYLGKYYVVERSTGTVIPLREGALAVSGTYPTVDSRTKAATGQVAALAASNGQYTDWVYKNQFSTISKSKALDGTWTYDAYYLSYAPGYLCDEHNYYITPSYTDEGWYVEKTTFASDTAAYNGNYHIHKDSGLTESQDQVAKGNVEISKVVSSSGQSNGLELEGAGFTFYLVSDLSKVEQFDQTRTGSYTLQSILDAYINKEYDNEHPKWDFSGETQAIAKTYEVNVDEKPLIERVVTVTGKSVKNPGNFLCRIGTPISKLIEAAGGMPEDTAKVIGGGPMMGRTMVNIDSPVMKGTSGVLLINEKEAARRPMRNCIRCGKCVSACPMGLEPYLLMKLSQFNLLERMEEEKVMDCIECGSCSFTCPSCIQKSKCKT